jgi:XTP/dITP diphosphohydrolase
MSRSLVIATGNAGKLKEIQQILAPFQWQVRSQKEFAILDADETGLSFVENAILKARHACAHTGLPALADDSGLEVDALQGAPCIYSARYSGTDATDARNNQKLLESLRDVPEAQRTARFQCVMVMMRHAADPTPLICQGTWEGRIVTQASGDNGFGYDPLFWVESHGCTSAQLDAATKNRLSHRAQALLKLVDALQASPAWRP